MLCSFKIICFLCFSGMPAKSVVNRPIYLCFYSASLSRAFLHTKNLTNANVHFMTIYRYANEMVFSVSVLLITTLSEMEQLSFTV